MSFIADNYNCNKERIMAKMRIKTGPKAKKSTTKKTAVKKAKTIKKETAAKKTKISAKVGAKKTVEKKSE
jgi:hypothetical protein